MVHITLLLAVLAVSAASAHGNRQPARTEDRPNVHTVPLGTMHCTGAYAPHARVWNGPVMSGWPQTPLEVRIASG